MSARMKTNSHGTSIPVAWRTVSVIVPTFNGINSLRDVCDSLERQTRARNIVQIIIVDDASTISEKRKRYEELLNEYRVLPLEIVYLERNRGPATARNAGIRCAVGEIVFFTDDDCILPSNAIELHLSAYRERPQISGVGGWYQSLSHVTYENTVERYLFAQAIHIFGMGLYTSSVLSSSFSAKPWLFPAVNTANFSVRRYVLQDVLFDEDFIAPGMEDIFFSEEIRKKGYILQYIPLLVFHRKNVTFKKFFKHCRNRGIGLFVYNRKYGRRWLEKIRVIREVKNFQQTLVKLSTMYPAMRKRRWRLLALHWIRYFIYSLGIMRLYYRLTCYSRSGSLPQRKYGG